MSTFFLVQIRCFRGTHVLSLALAFSPRSHGSFQWQIIFQNQDLGTRNIPIYFGKTKLSYLFLKHHWKEFHTNSGLMIMNSVNFDICRNLNIKRCWTGSNQSQQAIRNRAPFFCHSHNKKNLTRYMFSISKTPGKNTFDFLLCVSVRNSVGVSCEMFISN